MGAYNLMDDYSQGWSGYSFEDNALLSLQQEFMSEWQTPSPKNLQGPQLVRRRMLPRSEWRQVRCPGGRP